MKHEEEAHQPLP